MVITIDQFTLIEDLFKLYNEQLGKTKKKSISLEIVYAKHFSLHKIFRLADLVVFSNLDIKIHVLGDIDFTELAFAVLCHTNGVIIPKRCKIKMDSFALVSKEELTAIAEQLSVELLPKAKDIIKSYENNEILDQKVLFHKD